MHKRCQVCQAACYQAAGAVTIDGLAVALAPGQGEKIALVQSTGAQSENHSRYVSMQTSNHDWASF